MPSKQSTDISLNPGPHSILSQIKELKNSPLLTDTPACIFTVEPSEVLQGLSSDLKTFWAAHCQHLKSNQNWCLGEREGNPQKGDFFLTRQTS